MREKSLNGAAAFAVRAARLGFAAFGVAAVVDAIVNAGSLVNFFSFFTIESNLMAIVVLLVGGAVDPRSRGWAWVRGAVTFFMLVTGIVYAVLLANADVGLISAWVNSALHEVLPAVLVIDWLCFPPWPFGSVAGRADDGADSGAGGQEDGGAGGGRPWPALAWLGFPLAYLAYSLSRGAAVNWYPYPFLNPGHPGGYGRVAVYCVVLAVVMALLALGIAVAGRWRAAHSGRRRSGRSPVPAPGG